MTNAIQAMNSKLCLISITINLHLHDLVSLVAIILDDAVVVNVTFGNSIQSE